MAHKSKLTCDIHIRLSERDYQKIKQSADLYGQSISQYAQQIIQKSRLKKPKFNYQDAQKIQLELNRIGNNINQIARKINQVTPQNKLDFATFTTLASVSDPLQSCAKKLKELTQYVHLKN